ncbi:hypothetical protein Cantr_01718 [Candida viswanathii]|uniref:Uncharacterized protein n=1 Tax=Candida viswanathii TaxID=5486 RepID=A0A367YKD5_9ASCO|nr:hypothetical protein Cantr_01718 [Candida viswanathii]
MTTPTPTIKRFHILIESELQHLQNERCMFEVNDRTTLKEFKEQVIARNDEISVVRTYFEQLKLEYRGEEVPEYPASSGITVYEALHLDEDVLRETHNVVKLKVYKHENVNGTGGILSRDFWRDVRSERLQFLPQQDDERQEASVEEPREEVTATATEPTATPRPNIANIEPTKIAVQGGGIWEMEGTTYETLVDKSSGKKKLVSQGDLTSSEYVFTLEIDGETKKAVLNTSECIVVDNGSHPPYVLLNPSATAKLNSVFKLSSGEPLMQKVQIMMYTPPTPTQPVQQEGEQPAAAGAAQLVNDDLQRRIVEIGTRFGVNAIKLGIVLFLLGVRPNQHLVQHWFKYLVLFIILFNTYVMFFTGENRVVRFQGDFTAMNRLADAAVRRVVRRTTDRELILLTDPNWLKVVKWNLENITKDIAMYIMSLVPWLQYKIYEELNNVEDPVEEYEELIRQLDGNSDDDTVIVGDEDN